MTLNCCTYTETIMKTNSLSKFQASFNIVKTLSPIYNDANDAEKAHLATVMGASLWYLPTSEPLHFTGFISEEASKLPKKSRCKEHLYPRKVSATIMLENPPKTLHEFIEVCDSKFLRYSYVTSEENIRLKPYQKIDSFVSPEKAYELAGIKQSIAED